MISSFIPDKMSASRKKKLNKRKRLDPAQMKTTSEMLNEQASAEEDDSDSDVPVGEDEGKLLLLSLKKLFSAARVALLFIVFS